MKLFQLGSLALTLSVVTHTKSASASPFKDLKLGDLAANLIGAGKDAAEQDVNRFQNLKWENATGPIVQHASTAYEATKNVTGTAANGVAQLDWDEIPRS